jgi:coenzyme F420 hydrogenase subunit beta
MKTGSSVLEQILASDCCSGCGLCASLSAGSLEMRTNAEGFLRPHLNRPLSEPTDRLIGELCPGIFLHQTAGAGIDHPLWGPIIWVRVGAATDARLRHHASSGGALSAILTYLIDSSTVDYIVETAASSDAPLENMTVCSTDAAGIYRAAGSRYAPSAPLRSLHQMLDQPGRFALVAKPCDIAAARALGRRDKRVDAKIPVMLSFFCAGVPSLAGGRAILGELGVAEQDVASFRYRGDGWPGRASATIRDGSDRGMSYARSWGDILSHHVQFRCKICPDGSGGFADIVCGDAWHCDDEGYPLFEEADGLSLIISRSERGEGVVTGAIATGKLFAESMDVSMLEAMQPAQARRKRLVLSRLAGMTAAGLKVPQFRGLNLVRAARSASLVAHARSFLGIIRRLAFPRARSLKHKLFRTDRQKRPA